MTLPLENTLLAEFTYELRPVERGYANRTLYINLDDKTIKEKPVTQQMKDLFTGGRGFALQLLWHAVTPETRWNDPQNELIVANGPICGITAYPGTGKATVVTLGPLTENVIDSNVGGYFGPYLKFSGFDALEIQGKASGDIVLLVDGIEGKIEILEVSGLPESSYDLSTVLTDYFGHGKPQNISVVSTGPGARHTLIGCLNFTWFDLKRHRARYKQAGRGGIGTVFADKGIRALV